MSRVHDALRRAEQAGVLNLESGNAPAAPPPVLDHQGPARATENGAARVAVEDFAPGGLHPVILKMCRKLPSNPRRSRTCSICNVRMKPRRRNSGLCAHV